MLLTTTEHVAKKNMHTTGPGQFEEPFTLNETCNCFVTASVLGLNDKEDIVF